MRIIVKGFSDKKYLKGYIGAKEINFGGIIENTQQGRKIIWIEIKKRFPKAQIYFEASSIRNDFYQFPTSIKLKAYDEENAYFYYYDKQ